MRQNQVINQGKTHRNSNTRNQHRSHVKKECDNCCKIASYNQLVGPRTTRDYCEYCGKRRDCRAEARRRKKIEGRKVETGGKIRKCKIRSIVAQPISELTTGRTSGSTDEKEGQGVKLYGYTRLPEAFTVPLCRNPQTQATGSQTESNKETRGPLTLGRQSQDANESLHKYWDRSITAVPTAGEISTAMTPAERTYTQDEMEAARALLLLRYGGTQN
ncbi:hypothetical protein F5884DRAFT_756449 [Xylogone sp. PMI_703]|nr:hypothetical protein F5884DRAFT_756449 [Xylogone sp. PMI_703]